MRIWRLPLAALFACCWSMNVADTQGPKVLTPNPSAAPRGEQGAVDFQRDIRPILSNHCFKCHGPALQKNGVRLDAREAALKRKSIVPGNVGASKLIERITAEDDERMPPKEAGERLKPAQVELLKKWIAQGAEFTPHWAFLKPKQPLVPKLEFGNEGHAKLGRNRIDAFIVARLQKEGIAPSPEADRATLIRRVSLDLTGLLPSPKEVDDFLNDADPNEIGRAHV